MFIEERYQKRIAAQFSDDSRVKFHSGHASHVKIEGKYADVCHLRSQVSAAASGLAERETVYSLPHHVILRLKRSVLADLRRVHDVNFSVMRHKHNGDDMMLLAIEGEAPNRCAAADDLERVVNKIKKFSTDLSGSSGSSSGSRFALTYEYCTNYYTQKTSSNFKSQDDESTLAAASAAAAVDDCDDGRVAMNESSALTAGASNSNNRQSKQKGSRKSSKKHEKQWPKVTKKGGAKAKSNSSRSNSNSGSSLFDQFLPLPTFNASTSPLSASALGRSPQTSAAEDDAAGVAYGGGDKRSAKLYVCVQCISYTSAVRRSDPIQYPLQSMSFHSNPLVSLFLSISTFLDFTRFRSAVFSLLLLYALLVFVWIA